MIWLFRVNDVFGNDKPEVNEYYTFETGDINFDITRYDISLYFGVSDYYLLDDSNVDDIRKLRFVSLNGNPTRVVIPHNTEMCGIIKDFYNLKNTLDI